MNNIDELEVKESYVNKAEPIVILPRGEDPQSNKITLINDNISTKEDDNNKQPVIGKESNPFSILRNSFEYNKFDSSNGDSQ